MATLEEQLAEAKKNYQRIVDDPNGSVEDLTKSLEKSQKGIDRIYARIARIKLAQEAFQDACAVSPSPDLRGTTYRLFLEDALRRAE